QQIAGVEIVVDFTDEAIDPIPERCRDGKIRSAAAGLIAGRTGNVWLWPRISRQQSLRNRIQTAAGIKHFLARCCDDRWIRHAACSLLRPTLALPFIVDVEKCLVL